MAGETHLAAEPYVKNRTEATNCEEKTRYGGSLDGTWLWRGSATKERVAINRAERVREKVCGFVWMRAYRPKDMAVPLSLWCGMVDNDDAILRHIYLRRIFKRTYVSICQHVHEVIYDVFVQGMCALGLRPNLDYNRRCFIGQKKCHT